ncbi:MAG: DUF5659 domain-containing protein [Candidatus Hydromicrobium sp.]
MNEVFKTKDFYLACFLKAKGIKLLNASGEKMRDIVFTFQVENSEKLINDFYNENELIPAIKFVNAIRDLKVLCHNIKMRGERWQNQT